MKTHHFIMSTMAFIFLSYGKTLKAQFYLNTSVAISGSLSSFENVEFGPNADVHVLNGSEFYVLGATTTVDPDAEFTAPSSPTGVFIFQGTAQQTLDGGNSTAIGGAQPSLVNIRINNNSNVVLANTHTRLIGGVDFEQGHLLIGSQNLELSSDAVITNANESRYVVTNGSGFLAKESFSSAFTFPVGRATSDFTPATINPTSSDDFFVQVKDYSESASDEVTTADGIDRTWNIFSSTGAGANIALQHNSATNGADYNANGGDAAAFVTQYQGIQWVPYVGNQGVWEIGTDALNTSTSGSVSGSVIHNRDYTSTATSSSSSSAFFSKSTLELTPLPITLLDFDANKHGQSQSLISWTTTFELNSSYFEIETSTDNKHWTQIGKVNAKGVSYNLNEYQFLHTNPEKGFNYYRLKMVDLDGKEEWTEVKYVVFDDLLTTDSELKLYPNPTSGIVNLSSINLNLEFTLVDMHGRFLKRFVNTSKQTDFQVDLSDFVNGVYFIKAESHLGEVKTIRIILNN